MTTTNETKTTGIKGICCPKCNEADQVYLNLSDGGIFYCTSCEDEISRDEVEEMIESARQWAKALAWIDTMPTID